MRVGWVAGAVLLAGVGASFGQAGGDRSGSGGGGGAGQAPVAATLPTTLPSADSFDLGWLDAQLKRQGKNPAERAEILRRYREEMQRGAAERLQRARERAAAAATTTTRSSVLTDEEREQFRAELNRPGITPEERKGVSAKWRAMYEARSGVRRPVAQPVAGAPVTYGEVTPRDLHFASLWEQQNAGEGERVLGIRFRKLETEHYVIYTDWAASQDGFLKERFESAYGNAAKFFEWPAGQPVYVGKLPAFVLRSQDEFMRFAKAVDSTEPKDLRGYYHRNTVVPGLGHIVTYDALTGGPVGRLEWSALITHELTHSFVHRYRTDARPPMWVNEAVAMMVAGRQYPAVGRDYQDRARRRAVEFDKLDEMFHHTKGFMDLKYYPVARSVAEMLLKQDGKAFLAFFGDIKQGLDPEAALQKNYHMSYAELEKAWRKIIERT